MKRFKKSIILATFLGLSLISSAISEIYEKNPNIENKVLIRSAMEIGKDIMGTMANTLVFAYLSGSIPIILLVLRNSFPISL